MEYDLKIFDKISNLCDYIRVCIKNKDYNEARILAERVAELFKQRFKK